MNEDETLDIPSGTRMSNRSASEWPAAGTLAVAKRMHGQNAEAIAMLRAVRDCHGCYPTQFATNFAALGMPDSAIVYLEQAIAWNGSYGSYTGVELWDRLAKLYDARGDRAKAIAAYQRVVDLWRDADPALAPRVARARERIAALRGR